jgi:hypothetical protein
MRIIQLNQTEPDVFEVWFTPVPVESFQYVWQGPNRIIGFETPENQAVLDILATRCDLMMFDVKVRSVVIRRSDAFFEPDPRPSVITVKTSNVKPIAAEAAIVWQRMLEIIDVLAVLHGKNPKRSFRTGPVNQNKQTSKQALKLQKWLCRG